MPEGTAAAQKGECFTTEKVTPLDENPKLCVLGRSYTRSMNIDLDGGKQQVFPMGISEVELKLIWAVLSILFCESESISDFFLQKGELQLNKKIRLQCILIEYSQNN